ncbi:MAG: glutamate racemase [Verrucomicrobia bacterium]|jgi:glutamate racemase|nr:glutamate racemase [Verrucomicrobiota bacterium]
MQTDRPLDPIGVFDSGIGGLTVVAALREILPSENIFYIGDTARVPYGGKSRRTVERYGIELGGLLLAEHAKIIVVACNTASALAVPRMRDMFKVPVQGVVAPGAAAAVKSTRNKTIGVIGTRATIASGAYEHAIKALDPEVRVVSAACPLLVPLIEEGMFEDEVTDRMLARYLDPLRSAGVDTLVLGCTHYPLLRTAIARAAGPGVSLVDSAENCALAVRELLANSGIAAPPSRLGKLDVALTDATEGFLRTAAKALDLEIGDVALRSVQEVQKA